MSSMLTKPALKFALLTSVSLGIAVPAAAQNPGAAEWDRARQQMVAAQPSQMASVIDRWEYLIANRNLGFDQYAGFLLAYPGFPQEDRLRERAENRLDDENVRPETLVAYFDQNPPVTNAGKARYALALSNMARPEAADTALAAWRGGTMPAVAEAYLVGLYGSRFQPQDHDARMDALLWQGDSAGAARQINKVSPANRDLFMARLSLMQGQMPGSTGIPVPASARNDAGYTYNLAKYYRSNGRLPQAINLLAARGNFSAPAFAPEDFVGEALRIAKGAGARQAQQIASKVDDLFLPGADISGMAYRLRDDYTSLMWLGGTKAMWDLGDGRAAAPLFYRYGAAARTPQTRSKGFYWAGLASARAGDQNEAARYYEMAAAYPDRFYGMKALAKLGRTMPQLGAKGVQQPTQDQKAAFYNAPLTQAVREVSRNAPWRTGIQFYRAIAQNADTQPEHMLVTELARDIGRRDLAVNVAEAAGADGFDQFVAQGFPVLQTPPGTDWTFVHAVSRQESQFAQNAISHAGARGLMQLMPATAREQAGKLGMSYMRSNLIDSPSYNIRLGSAYFTRMLSYYDGSYPLAAAAYNAGPGNVNKWLRRNGDPRTGGIDYTTWIERIPIFETKNYVQRVLENAVVYEQLYPQQATLGRSRTVDEFLR